MSSGDNPRQSPPPRRPAPEAVDQAIRALCAELAPGRSLAPDDVARALDADHWQRQLALVRARIRRLAAAGEIEVLRKGKPVDAETARGVIRIRPTGRTG